MALFYFVFRSHANSETFGGAFAGQGMKKNKLYTLLKPSLEAGGAFELLWKVWRSGLVPVPRREQALVGGRGGVN